MHEHSHHHQYGPSYTGTVVLDIGADVGALVILTGADQLGREIEVSPTNALDPVRTHAAVRERRVGTRVLYGAVYATLPAGNYTVWADADTPVATVQVYGAEIAEFTWPN